MINFVIDKNEFELHKSRVNKLFPNYISFEKNSFNNNFKYFIGFDFDFIFKENFFKNFISFLKKIKNERKIIFYTLEPSPEDYFFMHFNKYSAFEVEIDTTYEDFHNMTYKDPEENTADAIGINSNEIAIFSQSNNWAILSSRDWEIAIVGFTSIEIKDKFLESFGEMADIFTTVKEQADILDEMLKFNEYEKMKYAKLVANYQDRF